MNPIVSEEQLINYIIICENDAERNGTRRAHDVLLIAMKLYSDNYNELLCTAANRLISNTNNGLMGEGQIADIADPSSSAIILFIEKVICACSKWSDEDLCQEARKAFDPNRSVVKFGESLEVSIEQIQAEFQKRKDSLFHKAQSGCISFEEIVPELKKYEFIEEKLTSSSSL